MHIYPYLGLVYQTEHLHNVLLRVYLVTTNKLILFDFEGNWTYKKSRHNTL